MKKNKVMCVQPFSRKNGETILDPTKDEQPQVGDIDEVATYYFNIVPSYTLVRFGEFSGFAASHFIDVTDVDEAIVGTIADALKDWGHK
jgi:hypothetical protein